MHEVELGHLICAAAGPGVRQPVVGALSQQAREQRVDDDGVEVLEVPDVLRRSPTCASRAPLAEFFWPRTAPNVAAVSLRCPAEP